MADEARQRGNEPGPVAEAVAANVAARRSELGWSRRELADRATAAGRRFTPEAIQKLESNGRRIDVDDLATLAMVLEVAATDLLGIGKATGRTTLRAILELTSRNPLLRRAIDIAVLRNHESVSALVDYVDFSARLAPTAARLEAEYAAWRAEVAAQDDTGAARMILEQASDFVQQHGWDALDVDAVAGIIGDERAEVVYRLIADGHVH